MAGMEHKEIDPLAHTPRSLREVRGVRSVSDMMVRSKLTRDRVEAIERGDPKVSVEDLSKYASAIDVDLPTMVRAHEVAGQARPNGKKVGARSRG